jgi:hypothetical protein
VTIVVTPGPETPKRKMSFSVNKRLTSTFRSIRGRPRLQAINAKIMHADSYDWQVPLRSGQPPAFTAKLRHYQDKKFAGLADG